MIALTQDQRAHLTAEHLQLLEARLSTYAELAMQMDVLEEQMAEEKDMLGSILEHAGLDKAQTEHYTMCWVRDAETSSLDKKKLISMGVTTEMLEQATVRKPKKPYFQIRSKSQKGVDKSAD